jgi:2-dehydropantoate 2-reductase
VDVVLVGVKTRQTLEAAQAIRPLIGPDTFVVPLQNGVEAPAQLAKVLGPEHVIGGLCGLISFIAGPGHIRHAGADPFIHFGELDNRASQRVERLRQAFAKSIGVTVEVPPDIQVALWRKFLLIVSWSGIGAITRSPIGVFRSLPQTRQMLQGVMQEVFSVAHAHHIALPDDVFEKTLAFMDSVPPSGTASMQRDIMEGRPSELESQTGAVVRLGQAVGVETSLNAFIYHSLLPLELMARGEIEFPD